MTDKPDDQTDEPERREVSDEEIIQAILKHWRVMESYGCRMGLSDTASRRSKRSA